MRVHRRIHRLRHLGHGHLRIAQQILRALVAGGIAQCPVADLLRAEPTPQRALAAIGLASELRLPRRTLGIAA